MVKTLAKRIDRYFEVEKYGSTIKREILAGLSVYLSLAYIFVVNPAILSQAGMDVSAVLFATILASGLSTLFMGFYAKLPFALAPGLEMNGFFAFVVVGTIGLSWNEALGAVFWSGVLCLVLTYLPVRKAIIDAIPFGLKKAMAVSVGVFVFTIGLLLAGIVTFENGQLSSFGSPFTNKGYALIIGLVISVVLGLPKLKFPGGMLVAIVASTIFCKVVGIVVDDPAEMSANMFLALFQLDVIPRSISLLPVFLVFFLIDFYGSIGKFIGLTASTNLAKKDGTMVRMDKALYVDGGGTVLGSFLGTSSIITYVESAIGIAVGGRTGLVAIVCGILMLLSLVFTPLVGLVPVEATAGILIYVGYLLIKDTWESRELTSFDYVVSGLMAVFTFYTFSLDKTMLLGFGIYMIYQIFAKKSVNWYLIISTLLIGASVVMQYSLN